jgi:hypothetical protein
MLGTDQNTDNQSENQSVGDWISPLPEELRSAENLPTLNKFKLNEGETGVTVPSTIIKSYIEAQKKIAQKGVLLPGENATDEDKNAFYKVLGRPDTPEGYGFAKPENLPVGVNYDEDRAKWFADLAHKAGLSGSQAKLLFDEYNQNVFQETEVQQKALKEFTDNTVKELKTEWGSKFEKNLQKSSAAAKLFGGKEFIDMLKNTGLDAHPVMIKAFLKVADRIGEASLVDGFTESAKPAMSKSTLEQMMKDPRYSGKSYDQDPEYIKQVQNGWKALEAAGQL